MQNESIPDARGPVFCGVDTHADSHWLYVLDWRGRKVLSRQFPADAAGYEALAGAIAAAGEPACIAMEGTPSYGAGLTRHLASLGMPVREALSPARTQRRRPGQGKCDEADAERAARAAMSGSRLGTPKSQDGWVDGVRCMLAARSGAVKARTSAINTARSLLTTAPEGLRSRFRGMGGLATLMWTVPGGAQETGGPYMRDPRHPRHFTDEFKRQIVDLYNAGKPKREIMDEYDLGKSTVERWIKSINATGSPRAACNRTPEQNRILELERENRRLRMEVDVLKQAALIYARK